MRALNNKTVLITGASQGLGRALAHSFAKEHANLILTARNLKRLKEIKTSLSASIKCQIIQGDIRDSRTIRSLQKACVKQRISILINNAGILAIDSLDKISEKLIDELITTNLKAPIILTKSLLPYFKRNKGGIIVNICSMAGKKGVMNHSVYCATKFGLHGFSAALQMELKPFGIKIINICPGAMKTNLFKGCADERDYKTFLDPADVANIVVQCCKCPSKMNVSELEINRMD